MAEDVVGMVLNETYRITSPLAEGAMGAVYLATHVRLPNKRFAVKILKGQVRQPELHVRFRREAEIATQLGHPNIVDVLDFNQMPDGHPYIVMEYLEGETLTRRLTRKQRLFVPELVAIMGQVGGGLQAAHQIGVVHRDIKPDNIFLVGPLDGPINCKILDFGVSKIRDSGAPLTRANALIGTLNYMSPEQASGSTADIDETTDIFALGTLSYRMLTNRLPFVGRDLGEVLDKIVYEEPNLELLPPSTRPVVGKALAKAKRARYQHVHRFVAELTQALQSTENIAWVDRAQTTVAPPTVGLPTLPTRDLSPKLNEAATVLLGPTVSEGRQAHTGVARADADALTEVEVEIEPDPSDLPSQPGVSSQPEHSWSITLVPWAGRRTVLLGVTALALAVTLGVWSALTEDADAPAGAPGADNQLARAGGQTPDDAHTPAPDDAQPAQPSARVTNARTAAVALPRPAHPTVAPPDARPPEPQSPNAAGPDTADPDAATPSDATDTRSAPDRADMRQPGDTTSLDRRPPRRRGRRTKRSGRPGRKPRRKTLGDRIPSL